MDSARRVLLAASLLTTLSAQTFDVASILPNHSATFLRGPIQYLPGGRLVVVNYPLQVIIAAAYEVPYQSPRLIGGPAWIRSDRYDIEAKSDASAAPPGMTTLAARARMRLMLQHLLADRFHLVLHRETRDGSVYAVTIGKNGPKLQTSTMREENCDETCHQIAGGQGKGIHAHAASLADLIRFCENFTDRPLLDRTALHGLYDIETTGWVSMRDKFLPAGAKAEDGSDLATMQTLPMLFEQLGLKLEPSRAPIEVLVIDRVERPSEN